jgi:hypothetical protein
MTAFEKFNLFELQHKDPSSDSEHFREVSVSQTSFSVLSRIPTCLKPMIFRRVWRRFNRKKNQKEYN